MLLYWPNKDDSFPIGHILINWKALWNSADVHMCMCVKQLEALRVSGMLALACWEKINGPWYILSWWKSVCQHDTTCAGECDRLSTHYTLVCVGGMGLRNYVCTSVCTVHMSRSVHRWKKCQGVLALNMELVVHISRVVYINIRENSSITYHKVWFESLMSG